MDTSLRTRIVVGGFLFCAVSTATACKDEITILVDLGDVGVLSDTSTVTDGADDGFVQVSDTSGGTANTDTVSEGADGSDTDTEQPPEGSDATADTDPAADVDADAPIEPCGDGVLDDEEACDDANGSDGDGCSLACEVEDGFQCAGEPSVCTRTCGDGDLTDDEECDDGNDVDTDDCTNACTVARCGDGVVQAGVDECDDGNDIETDACRNNCVPAFCGDGIIHTDVEDCDDGNDEDNDACPGDCLAYRSCAAAQSEEGITASGVYLLRPDPDSSARRVYCDMETDGGGWTLVASTLNQTLNDQAGEWHTDLTTLAPEAPHEGVWDALRALGADFDVRFACRAAVGAAADPFTVDLSFYDVPWYMEMTTGTDAESCLSENQGSGADIPVPARRDNIGGRFRTSDNLYNFDNSPEDHFLEIEDFCDDEDDFTVDFDDRGMDGNGSDGTDWGEDDGSWKCGTSELTAGQWFIFAREHEPTNPRVALVGMSESTADLLEVEGFAADMLPYDAELPALLTGATYETIVIGGYTDDWTLMTPELIAALDGFARGGGNIVTESDGAAIFMTSYDPDLRTVLDAPTPLGLFDGSIGGGYSRGTGSPITQIEADDPVFAGVLNPFSAGDATDSFFWISGSSQLQILATFEGDVLDFPAPVYGTVFRGTYCDGNMIFTTFDWDTEPDNPGFGPLVGNLLRAAGAPPSESVVDVCPE